MTLQALEQSLDSLALTSFGVMDTTLEEVFLKVSEEDQSLENSDAGKKMSLFHTSKGFSCMICFITYFGNSSCSKYEFSLSCRLSSGH